MPEQSAGRRGSGAAVAAHVSPIRRRYTRADAGPPCGVCGTPVVAPLAAAGITEHPTCDPDMHELLRASRAAEERLNRAP